MNGNIKPFSPNDVIEASRLQLALEAAGIGTWQFDISSESMLWCDRSKALYHFPVDSDDSVSFKNVVGLVHPDDQDYFRNAFIAPFKLGDNTSHEIEFRVTGIIQGQTRWLLSKGQIYFDDAGVPEKIVGTVQNITREILDRQQLEKNSKPFETRSENNPDFTGSWGNYLKTNETRYETLIEQAPMAIGLLRGKDMVVEVGNDRIFEVWGKDRSVIGKPIIEALPEIKNQNFLSLLTHVYQTGESYQGSGALAKILRNGKLQDLFFDFVYTPLRDKSGDIDGIMVLATEVTAQFVATRALETSEIKFRSLVEEAPVATCLFVGPEHKIEVANNKMISYWGKDKSIFNKPVLNAIPELEGQPFIDLLDQVFRSGITYEAQSAPADLVVNGVLSTYYFDYTYKPLRNPAGEIYGVMNMAHDVTSQVHARRSLEASEEKLRSVFANASAAMGLFVGRDLVIELANQAFIDVIGKGQDITKKKLSEVIPELQNQESLKILGDVFDTGKSFQRFESQVNLLRNGVMTSNYYNITYTPLFNSEGEVYAILDIGIDVTDAVLARQKLEESELFAHSIINNSPVAKLVFTGYEMIIRTVNENMLAMLGKDSSIIGKPFMEAVPELLETPLMNRLRQVLQTGISYNQPEEKIDLIHNGEIYSGYYNYNYKALQNTAGENYGVLVTAIEVTAQVNARQKIEEAEQILRDAVELAELATWSIDPKSGEIGYGSRMKEWIGVLEDDRDFDMGVSYIPEKDRERIRLALLEAFRSGSDGIYEEQHLVENVLTGQRRYIHAKAKTFFDAHGNPYKMIGTAQDITQQREVQNTLEQLVQQRTEELETMNEELAAINEEYMATNEDLAQSNHLLIQSNQSLQQFAYVASHDLQEPLRKIQSFGNLLFNRYSEGLGEGVNLILRMQAAAARMSGLIEDLLAFSRVSNQRDVTESLSLSDIVQNVLSDLEVTIQDTEAVITIEKLPVIMGDESQLGQLFQNLLTNALKFRQKDQAPVITVNCRVVSFNELPATVKPAQISQLYYQIDVIDNGIGFEQKYSERIFQLFQRLHGRSEFAGTGIGLSICERVAANHGGAITALSEPAAGSTFSIYLPI